MLWPLSQSEYAVGDLLLLPSEKSCSSKAPEPPEPPVIWQLLIWQPFRCAGRAKIVLNLSHWTVPDVAVAHQDVGE